MRCEVIDGIFDNLFLHELDSKITQIPVKTNNIANRKTWPYGHSGSHKLFGATLFKRVGLNRVTDFLPESEIFFDIFETIEKVLGQNFLLKQIALNVQHTNCDGSTHIDEDDSEYTILMMTNAVWESSWGGQFQLTSYDGKEVIEEYDYVPGRVIVMPSDHPHRGLGPTEPYIYRTSIIFRVSPTRA